MQAVAGATPSFAARLIHWQRQQGRHDLPWQHTRDAYRVWVSEVMLQQTQVASVMPYYARWLARFPDVASLATASEDEVMTLWAGLGYYRRARHLHEAARQIVARGRLPQSAQDWAQLPGVGRSTAAAIASICLDEAVPILDGNVKRVLARWAGVRESIDQSSTVRQLWRLAEDLTPPTEAGVYNQALMDLGSQVCVTPSPSAAQCETCPLTEDCQARQHGWQALLPVRARPKQRPERQCHVLWLLHEDAVYLEKRPPTGVWPGLWAPPQFDTLQALSSYCVTRACEPMPLLAAQQLVPPASTPPSPPVKLAPLHHQFTHFSLTLYPHVYRSQAHWVQEGGAWMPMQHPPDYALPAPIARMLRELKQVCQSSEPARGA